MYSCHYYYYYYYYCQKKDKKNPRSREMAKECRKRQRARMEEMEQRVKELTTENRELYAHVLNVYQRTTEVQRQKMEMEKIMADKVVDMNRNTFANARPAGSSSSEEGLEVLVTRFTDLYADYGACRQREIQFHVDQLEKLLLPTRTTKMCLWTLQQDNNFFVPKSSPLFKMLSKELDLLPEQASQIQNHRYITLYFRYTIHVIIHAIDKKYKCF